jgi:hypothetical protein
MEPPKFLYEIILKDLAVSVQRIPNVHKHFKIMRMNEQAADLSAGFPQIILQVQQAEQEDQDLACQKPPQISFDPEDWDQEEDARDPYAETCRINAEGKRCLSDSVDHADQGVVGVQERADPG